MTTVLRAERMITPDGERVAQEIFVEAGQLTRNLRRAVQLERRGDVERRVQFIDDLPAEDFEVQGRGPALGATALGPGEDQHVFHHRSHAAD